MPGGSVASMIRRGTVGAAVLLLLCACASPSSPASSAPPTATATAQQSTTTTTTTAAPKPYTFAISCGGKKYADYKAAWPDNPEMCSADESGATAISPEQQAAMKAAGYVDGGRASVKSLGTLYSLCAETGGYYATPGNSLSGEQAAEASGMLMICPDFPQTSVVKANMKAGATEEAERAAGTRFSDGSYRVGAEVKPGTYAIEKASQGCYWERIDNKGNIIDNNFVAASTRVEVTIKSTDYTFRAEGCGEWVKS